MRDQYVNLLAANPELDQEFSSLFLRGSDYTRKTQQLAEERRDAEAKLRDEWGKFQSEKAKLEQWQGQVQGDLNEYNKVIKEMPAVKARMAAAEQALRDYQIYDQVSLPSVDVSHDSPTPKPPMQRDQTPTNPHFVTLEDANNAMSKLMALNGKIMKIQAQHQRLFGEPLDDDLIDHFARTGEDPEAHWRVKYGVEAKQAELRTRNEEAERARIREEERAKIMAEISSDPGRVVGSPLQRGGMPPVMERYAASRATAHSQNHANDNPAPKADDFIPPEKRPDIQASRERVAAAQNFFYKHWDDTGNAVNDAGRALSSKYAS